MTRVLGVDPSLTRTGLALPTGRTISLAPKNLMYGERLHWFRTQLDPVLAMYRPQLASIEGYSLGSPGMVGKLRLAELGGIIRAQLAAYGCEYVEVPPAELKKWATGRGNADKAEMVAAAETRGAQPANDDEADAALLRFKMLEAIGQRVVSGFDLPVGAGR